MSKINYMLKIAEYLESKYAQNIDKEPHSQQYFGSNDVLKHPTAKKRQYQLSAIANAAWLHNLIELTFKDVGLSIGDAVSGNTSGLSQDQINKISDAIEKSLSSWRNALSKTEKGLTSAKGV